MAKSTTTVSEEGMVSTSRIRDWDVSIDPTGESAPDTLELLLADYAACAVPAFRVGAKQRGVDDLGHLEIDASGELNEDDKLASVSLDVRVETELEAEQSNEIIERVEALCKVHDALKPELHAAISLEGGAF